MIGHGPLNTNHCLALKQPTWCLWAVKPLSCLCLWLLIVPRHWILSMPNSIGPRTQRSSGSSVSNREAYFIFRSRDIGETHVFGYIITTAAFLAQKLMGQLLQACSTRSDGCRSGKSHAFILSEYGDGTNLSNTLMLWLRNGFLVYLV